ncbi:G-protein coupled receptor Mth2 [Ooceraea biroi]|nr:G-protein coupled receptor Mth2 [Ooceraea biroi]
MTKCCPPGHIFSGNPKVECVPAPSNATQLHVLQRNATGEFQGLPQCDEPEDVTTMPLNSFDSNRFIEVPACLEIVYDQETEKSTVTVVSCRSNKDRQMKTINASLSQLAHIRKCCPQETIFDERTKTCVSWTNESQSVVTFLPNGLADVDFVIISSEGPPTCKGPIVDYKIDPDDIFLRNDTFSVIVPAFKNDVIVKEELLINEDDTCLEMIPDTVSNRRLIARICRPPEFCDKNACIRKCCAEDEFFYAKGCNKFAIPEEPKEFYQAFASAVNQTESSAFNTSNDYGVLIGKPCRYDMFPVHPSEEKWFATSEGHILIEGYPLYRHNQYCMDIFYNNSMTPFDQDFHLFMCFNNPVIQENRRITFRVNTALEIVSCTFLLITLLVYVCLPSLQNLHGKTLMCHVGSLFLAFTCLAILTWVVPGSPFDNEEKETARITCKALAYTMLFCFLSSFSWLNVMCFDIWWTFGILRGSTITKARGHRKKFLLYCSYAWGLSLLVSILAIVADSTDILPDYLQPDIGNRNCWFTQDSSSYGELTFFIGPVTVQLIVNMVFFILTSVHCNKVKAEIRRMTTDPADPRSKRFHSDRIKFMMNIKLFIVMGISWTCEVISFLLKKYLEDVSWHQTLFYASDVFNLLQGLLIFILFVLKNRVYQALRKRLGFDNNKKPSPTCNAKMALQDPHRVRKSASTSTLTTTFVISSAP